MKILEILKRKRNFLLINFNQIAEQWLEYKKINIKKSSYSNYEYIIKKYIKPFLEGKKLIELEKYNFNDLVNKLSLELSSKTVRDIICVLKAILHYIEDEYKCNLKTEKIKYPKQEAENIIIFSNSEKKKIEEYCMKKNDTKELGILICLNTGLRIGEICALKWKNIDLDKRIIYVKSTVERIYEDELKNTKIIIDKSKTQKSVREIPISNKLYVILKPLKKKYKDDDFFLTGKAEKYIEPRCYQYVYKKLLKNCNIKPHKFHCLRHSFASECIEVGMDARTLSEILGHVNVSVTLNRYVHTSYKMKLKYLEKI